MPFLHGEVFGALLREAWGGTGQGLQTARLSKSFSAWRAVESEYRRMARSVSRRKSRRRARAEVWPRSLSCLVACLCLCAALGADPQEKPGRRSGNLHHIAIAPDGTSFFVAGEGLHSYQGALFAGDLKTARLVWWADCPPVNALAVSPDSKLVVTGHAGVRNQYGEVRIWDSKTGALLRTLLGHRGPVRAAVFSPDGASLATGGSWLSPGKPWAGEIRVWDSLTGNPKSAILNIEVPVQTLAYAGAGKLLAGCARDHGSQGRLIEWDLAKGRQLRKTEIDGLFPVRLCLSPDGSLLATLKTNLFWVNSRGDRGQLKSEVIALDARTGKPRWASQEFQGRVTSLQYSPDGVNLLAGVELQRRRAGHTAVVYEFEWMLLDSSSGAVRREVRSPAPLAALTFTPDGETIVTAGPDAAVRYWSPETGQQRAAFARVQNDVDPDRGSPAVVRSRDVGRIAFSASGDRLLTLESPGVVRVWRLLTLEDVMKVGGDNLRLSGFAVDPGGAKAFVVGPSLGGSPGLLSLSDGAVGAYGLQKEGPLEWLSLSRDGRVLATGGAPEGTNLWDCIPAGIRLRAHLAPDDGGVAVLSPDGDILAVGDAKGVLTLYETRTARRLSSTPADSGAVAAMGWLSGERVVTGGRDGAVRVWESAGGRLKGTIRKGGPAIRALACSADGHFIAALNQEAALELWDALSRKRLWSREGGFMPEWSYDGWGRLVPAEEPPALGSCLAFSPDGRTIASGWADGKIMLTDTESGRPLAILTAD
jgi:WD40 repeat protein